MDVTRMENAESVHSEHQRKKATSIITKMSNQSNIRDDEGQDNLTDLEDEYMDDFVQPRTLREFNVPRAGHVGGTIRLPRIMGQKPDGTEAEFQSWRDQHSATEYIPWLRS